MEKSKVIRSAGLIGGLTMVSRLLGLVRDVLMAGFFGTTLPMSAFVVAFTIPNLFRRLFGEGALSAGFVPVFVETREKAGDKEAWALARTIFTIISSLLLAIVVLAILAATAGMHLPGLGPRTAMILPLLRIMMPYMLMICLAALSMGILNSFSHFAVPAATPCILNTVWILSLLFLCPRLGVTGAEQIRGVAWGVLLAGVLQLGFQVPILRRHGYRFGFSLDGRDGRVRKVFSLMGPAAMGMAVTQVNVMIDRLLAYAVGPWAPAALFYSERLIYLPLGIFATALGTVLLPVFSRQAARNDHESLRDTINHSLRNLLFVMVPASVGLWVLAEPIVTMIFQWKAFDATSTGFTTIALQCYAPGLLVFSLAKVFVPAFYALQDTRTPLRVGLWTVAIKFSLSILFVLTLPLHLKHAGLATATVLAEGFYGLRLAYLLHRRLGSPGWKSIGIGAVRAGIGAAGMAVVAALVMSELMVAMISWEVAPKCAQIGSVVGAIAAAGITYGLLALLLQSRELTDIFSALVERRKRRKGSRGN